MTSNIPFDQNHELHGALIALGTMVVMQFGGKDLCTSASVGALVGATATAAMKTVGHGETLRSSQTDGTSSGR